MWIDVTGAGGANGKTSSINIDPPYDFILNVGDKKYRFTPDRYGNLILCLINGVDARITTMDGFPAIRLTNKW